MKYSLKEILKAVIEADDNLSGTCSNKTNQILLKTKTFPDEVMCLLSPYYQERITSGKFNDLDLKEIIGEAKRFIEIGW